jgi:hypothetical protein
MNDQQPENQAIENDDVEAHRALSLNDNPERKALDLDDEDVEGHKAFSVQPPRDADNSGNQF